MRYKTNFFFFNDTATTEIYTLSLHDALPICHRHPRVVQAVQQQLERFTHTAFQIDRKSTRLNSSHLVISYAVFCLKKKINYLKNKMNTRRTLKHYELNNTTQLEQGDNLPTIH